MNESVEQAQFAWQPLTVRGVAAFARVALGRLLLVQFIVALLAAGMVVWFVHKAWFPQISEAIRQLPVQGELREGRLDWQGATPARLAEGRFLALVVDLDHAGEARSPAHVQVEFGRTDCMVFSLFGYVQGAYPRGPVVAFNSTFNLFNPGKIISDGRYKIDGNLRLGAGYSGHGGGVGGGGVDGDLGVPGDGLFSAGLAGRILRKPGLELARELAPGRRGADAGGAVYVCRRIPLRLRRDGPRGAGSGWSAAPGDKLGVSNHQSLVLAPASGGGGEGKSVRMIAYGYRFG